MARLYPPPIRKAVCPDARAADLAPPGRLPASAAPASAARSAWVPGPPGGVEPSHARLPPHRRTACRHLGRARARPAEHGSALPTSHPQGRLPGCTGGRSRAAGRFTRIHRQAVPQTRPPSHSPGCIGRPFTQTHPPSHSPGCIGRPLTQTHQPSLSPKCTERPFPQTPQQTRFPKRTSHLSGGGVGGMAGPSCAMDGACELPWMDSRRVPPSHPHRPPTLANERSRSRSRSRLPLPLPLPLPL